MLIFKEKGGKKLKKIVGYTYGFPAVKHKTLLSIVPVTSETFRALFLVALSVNVPYIAPHA